MANPNRSKNLLAALEYQKLGWKVFPLRPRDKRPLSPRGFHDATDDVVRIEQWWLATPGAGVGLPTGEVNSIIVLDVDPRNGGNESFAALEVDKGPLPETVEARTGGGGRHLVFKHPGGVLPGVRGAYPGVDIKSDGGYIAVPFSVHPSGTEYRWLPRKDPILHPIAEAPEWLVDLLRESKRARIERNIPEPSQDGDLVIPEGGRNDALASLAGTMHRRAMAYDAILVALLAQNEARCVPPLPEGEVKAIVDSITGRYSPDPEASVGERRELVKIEYSDVVSMAAHDPNPVDWLITGRLAKGDCSLLVGPPGCGKSWIALDLAIAGAAGLPPLGMFTLDRPIKTIYIDEENPIDEVHRRVRALVTAWEIDPEKLHDMVLLSTPCQGLTFRMHGFRERLRKDIEGFKPDLVILDSITAISNITDENAAIEVRKFFHDELYPLRQVCGSTILGVHHTSKAIYQRERAVANPGLTRGSIDFNAAPDSVLLVEQALHNDQGPGWNRLEMSKIRRGEAPAAVFWSVVNGQAGGARPMARKPGIMTGRVDSKATKARMAILDYFSLWPAGSRRDLTDIAMYVKGVLPDVTDDDIRKSAHTLADAGELGSATSEDNARKLVFWFKGPQ